MVFLRTLGIMAMLVGLIGVIAILIVVRYKVQARIMGIPQKSKEEEKISCKHCGEKVNKDSKFCNHCGKEL